MTVALRFASLRQGIGLALLLLATLSLATLSLAAQPPDPAKKPTDPPKAPLPREAVRAKLPLGPRLSDGTYTFNGSEGTEPEGIVLTPAEHQKLLDQLDQLRKQLAGRKTQTPSSCAIRAKVENRGEAGVSSLKLTYSFRTTTPHVAVILGARRGFLIAAALDNNKLAPIESGEEGFTVLVESTGDHTVVLDVECPISSRGLKPEIGFELGLPRAAITTLIFEPPPGIARVALVTRVAEGKAAEPRRVSGLDVKGLAAPPPNKDPYPLGPIESLEVLWDTPATAATIESTLSAELDIVCLVADGFVETSVKFRPRGSARSWRFAAPSDATISVDRAPGSSTPTEGTPADTPVVNKPTDAAKPVWKVDLPAGSTGSDWIVTALVRMPRPKPSEPNYKGPFPIGPFAVLDASRQSGAIKVAASPNTRLVVKHGPELRQQLAPMATDGEVASYFKLAAGPSGAVPTGALFTVEAQPLVGKLAIRPVYKLTLTEAGWAVRAELRISPIRTAIDSVAIELPAGWRGTEVSPPEIVDRSELLKSDGARQVLTVRLAAEHKQPFDLVLSAVVPVTAARESLLLLPRFPNAIDRDATATVSVPEGLEVRCIGREFDGDQPAAWGQPLTAASGAEGKEPRATTALSGKFERGLARLDLAWSPYRPPLAAEVRAEIVVHDHQAVVTQRVMLRTADGLPRTVRFQSAPDLKGLSPFELVSPGVWAYFPPPDAKEASLKFEYSIPIPRPPADGSARQVSIGLVLPIGVNRTETTARVWVASGAGRTVRAEPGPWRELAPEPASDRDSLPALTLAGSGSELPLVLEVREAPPSGAAAVWVDRGLLQASIGDEGTAYRARFLLRRWLADSVEIRLPESLGGGVPEVYLDEPPKRIQATIATQASGVRTLRIPLPEAKPGRTAILDLRYKLPAGSGEEGIVYAAPEPIAAFAGPVRWSITGPNGTVPLVIAGGRPEQRWRTRFGLFVPVSPSVDELEKWFQTGSGDEAGSGSADAVVVRVTATDPVTVVHLSRLYLVIGCSAGFLLLGLLVSRLPGGILGVVVAVLAGAVAVGAVWYPQPAAQIAAAAEPGIATLALVLAVQTATRWYYRQRVTYLPGFARSRPEVPGNASTSGGSQPKRNLPAHPGPPGSSIGASPPQSASTGS